MSLDQITIDKSLEKLQKAIKNDRADTQELMRQYELKIEMLRDLVYELLPYPTVWGANPDDPLIEMLEKALKWGALLNEPQVEEFFQMVDYERKHPKKKE